MKLRKLLTTALLLIAVGGFASAAITSGYYRIISYNSKYLTENTSSHELICSDLIDGNYSQVWYLNVSGTSVTFTNVLTDRYVQGSTTLYKQWVTTTTSNDFTMGESSGVCTFANSGTWGIHCDNSNNVVGYYTSDDKSKWTVVAATVDNEALAAQRAAISEASTTDLLKVFTTTACTELKGSYSESDLTALPSTVQAMAAKIKNNSWTTYSGWDKTEKTFRVADYKAYSSRDRWTSIIGLGYSFGRLTNPTGISVTAGDYIQVYVGTIPSGQTVKLEVAGQYQAVGTTYALHQGMNVLLMASSGNCFVQYEVDNTTSGNAPYTALSSYADVTVHIEGGTVNGYFDLTKGDDNDDWASLQAHLLTGTSVDIKTSNLLFHMNTDLVTAACPSKMVELLGEWDKILDMEYSLMGLEEFNGYWNNLLSVTDMSGQDYMHASTYGTYYADYTISSVMSYEDLFAGGALWGPAHENGHIFQKYINMVGQTEVSNNLFSNVAVFNNGHLTSRASNISVTFGNMANNVFWNDRDIWERTHLYFQLYQFFHILGNDPDFYPELFKAFRSDPMVHTGGIFTSATDDYLKFYKKCCQVSGYDLTEFFQAYGFFVIPTMTSYTLNNVTKDAYKVEDYGNYYLTVTQDEINTAKAEVAAMNLPKANIIFIEDRITAPDATYTGAPSGAKKTAFNDECLIGQAGETGQYTTFGATCSAYKYNVKDGDVTMEGTGAVGFKVYDSTGNLRGLYNSYNFTLPDGIGADYVIKAAAGDGTDAEATFDATVAYIASDVTDAGFIKAGSQITAESQLVSGQLYLIYYVGNGSPGYMKDTGSAYTGKDDDTAALNAVYQIFSNGDGTWKVQNYATGKYWGTPTANANSFIGSDTPGSWTLNFQSNNNVAPSCNGHSWNRSGSNIHPWNTGTANVNQLKIMAVSPATELADEFDDKDVSVSSEAAASLETGKWYVMFDRGANHGYLYENGENKLYNTATAPSGSATDNAKYLVRIVGWNNEYYIQTGLGNFFGNFQHSTNVLTTASATEQIIIKKIAGTDGHFYLMSAEGIVLDANALTNGDATVVGYGTTVPTATGGNNDWAFYPVEFVDSWIPAISEVYTINNTNTNRGAMMYNSASNYVWSSGKSGTFSATDTNFQWVLVPTGTSKQYYLYNVGAGKFAVPSGTNSTASWVFSNDAVPVTFIKQSDGTFKIKTATTDTYAAVSNGYNGPIINYNDAGGNFTITKVDGDQSTAVTAALNKLMKNQTALTAVPTGDGWYAIRIKAGTYADEFIYAPDSEIAYASGRNYPLTFMNNVNKQPSVGNTAYLTYIKKTDNGYAWCLPDGKYLYNNSSNYFPTSTVEAVENVQLTYNSGFKFSHNNGTKNLYAVAYYLSSKYFIGESDKESNGTSFDLYPVNLSDAGLTAWKVVINGASASTKLTCTRNDVNGLTAVYNNGYFFLPTGTTPVDSDFSLTGMISCVVDADAKAINVEYDPELSLLAADVVVNQGNQTTGKGNTMQALLRIMATPFSDFQPTQFSINLSGASNVDNVKVYATTADQIRAAGVTPTLLGTAASPSDGTVNIDVTASSIAAGTTLYYWITADVKSTATEWGTIDASLASISYTNAYKEANSLAATALDLSSVGNPAGEMRIYKQQSELWTASMAGSQYYRIPAIINTNDGGILALTDDRFGSTQDLGNHKINVVARKSMDGGLTWGDEILVAAGDGSSDAAYGYGDPAVVRTLNGKLICLMAAGKSSYSGGMLHMGYTESSDNGATWSAPVDIYSSIDKNGTTFQSVFTTAGKGVTFSNGRVAFAMNGKVNGTTNEYIIYSDDEGATWTISPTIAFSGADESKLEIMNDNSLLVSVRRGGFNSMANRGYNRTTGDASGNGIDDWGTQGNWGNEMNANGCNADILYYNRETENADRLDVIFHTLTKTYSTFRKDLRLYMSFDQGTTWKEAFQLQPGYAAYSSMQKLANGDLAIIFEDGSIGNEDKQDCYAITYVVLSSDIVNAKIDEVYDEIYNPLVKNSVAGSSTGANSYGSFSDISNTWAKTWTSNASSGKAGVTISTDGYVFNHSSVYDQRCFAMRPSTAGATDVISITAPDGFIIESYTITGRNYSSSQTYQLFVDENEKTTTSTSGNTFSVNNVNAKSTTFKFYGSSMDNYLCVTNFTIKLRSRYSIVLNQIGEKSYATLYLPYGITLPDDVTAYKIAVDGSVARPTSMGQDLPANTPALLISETGVTNATATINAAATADVTGNVLVGTTSAGYVDGYVLNAVADQIGFYRLASNGSLAAKRAYIPSSLVGSLVKAFLLPDGTETGVSQTEVPENKEAYYSLSGVKVKGKPTVKGVFIQPGRKVVVQ